MKIELHVHTRFSCDSLLPLILLRLRCKVKKISAIAITDHNTIKGAKRLKQIINKRGINLQVIVGEEIMTTEGEIIGLFLEDEIDKGLTPEQTIDKIRNQNGIVYIPHPYDEKRQKTVISELALNRNIDRIDCIECYNGRNWEEEYGNKQDNIARKTGKVKVIGSDAHTFIEVGRNTMMSGTSSEINRNNFLKIMSEAKYQKEDCIKFAHKITKFARLINYIFRGDINGLFRAFNKKIRRRV